MLDGTMTAVPRQRFGVADVRDVADAHIRAMTTPAAAGQRFLVLADGPTISWLILAQILRDRLGPPPRRAPAAAAAGAPRRAGADGRGAGVRAAGPGHS